MFWELFSRIWYEAARKAVNARWEKWRGRSSGNKGARHSPLGSEIPYYNLARNSSTPNPDLLIISRKVPGARSLPWCTGAVSEVRPGYLSRTCEPVWRATVYPSLSRALTASLPVQLGSPDTRGSLDDHLYFANL